MSFGSCFGGQALWGEPCLSDADCGPAYACQADGVCADVRSCDDLRLTLADLRPQVVLVLDHSLSMQRCLDAPASTACGTTPELSRWDGLATLVATLVESLAGRVDFAAVVFPSDDNPEALAKDPCRLGDDTQIAFGPDAAKQLVTEITGWERLPEGENPIRRAFVAAADLLDAPGDGFLRRRAIVLVSDNPPNCAYKAGSQLALILKLDGELMPLVAEARAAGVPTFVVGLGVVDEFYPVGTPGVVGGVNPHVYFGDLAAAGGTPQTGADAYIRVEGSADLPAAVDALTEQLGLLGDDFEACRVRLEETPNYDEYLAVELGGRLHAEDPACADPLAWRWLDGGRTELQLCPDACARLHAAPVTSVRLRFGCP